MLHTLEPTVPVSKASRWTGRILTALVVLFLAMDGVVKVLNLPAAVDATTALGYPARLVVPLGVVQLMCLGLYVVPRASLLGAILLTGWLGGATASQVRVESAFFLLPVVVGTLVWAGLYFRRGSPYKL